MLAAWPRGKAKTPAAKCWDVPRPHRRVPPQCFLLKNVLHNTGQEVLFLFVAGKGRERRHLQRYNWEHLLYADKCWIKGMILASLLVPFGVLTKFLQTSSILRGKLWSGEMEGPIIFTFRKSTLYIFSNIGFSDIYILMKAKLLIDKTDINRIIFPQGIKHHNNQDLGFLLR